MIRPRLPYWTIPAIFVVGAFWRIQSMAATNESKSTSEEPTSNGVAPVALIASNDGSRVYVTEGNCSDVVVAQASDGKILGRQPLPAKPNGLAISPDGAQFYVTTDTQEGVVLVVDAKTLRIESEWHASHNPDAPVVSPDGKLLYLCNRFDDSVSILDTATGNEIARIPVQREPVAAAITPDGGTLLVANLLPNHPADGDYTGAAISVIDTGSRKVESIDLINGASSVRGICVSPDGRFAYAAHVMGHYQLPCTQVERGWMNAAALSVIDIRSRKLINTVLLDDEESGAANPWGATCSPDGRFLCITHAGTHELSVIDRKALHDKLGRAEKGAEGTVPAVNVPDDYSFLTGIRTRIKLDGNGPRALAIHGDTAFIAEYFSDTVAKVNISHPAANAVVSIPLGSRGAMSQVHRGEMLFNDATLCRQHWQSCASCHPDGRMDGLNWDLLNDGIGNPKNTKSLLFAHLTSPVTWLGVRKSAEEAVRAGFRYIEFTECTEEDAQAVDAYLKSLTPVPSPHLVNGRLSPSAERGKKVFEQADCIDCHTPPLFTNAHLYDLDLAGDIDKGKPFVVPSLVEAWRTAPYLHDGRATTIRDVITTFNKNDVHGSTSTLTEQEINDLVEYVLSQ